MKGLATVARAIAVTLGIGFGGFMVFAVWAMNGHGADPKTFAMVTNGMTKAQVERLLGPPH
ncbi:MAG: outer membrane protein assembly factor BamE [Kiritimatiellae bacterium]|nr:outer membrane protein assembly factor BamE [Kiritimatiellia bacterium]